MHALVVQCVDHLKGDLVAVLVLKGHQVGLIFLVLGIRVLDFVRHRSCLLYRVIRRAFAYRPVRSAYSVAFFCLLVKMLFRTEIALQIFTSLLSHCGTEYGIL